MMRCSQKILSVMVLSSIMLLSFPEQNADAFWKKGKEKKEPRVIAVFVDMSGSTNRARRTVYRNAFDKVYQNLQQGDRIIVGTITGRSYIDFKPVVDAEIPRQSIWVNRIKFTAGCYSKRLYLRLEMQELREQQFTKVSCLLVQVILYIQ